MIVIRSCMPGNGQAEEGKGRDDMLQQCIGG